LSETKELEIPRAGWIESQYRSKEAEIFKRDAVQPINCPSNSQNMSKMSGYLFPQSISKILTFRSGTRGLAHSFRSNVTLDPLQGKMLLTAGEAA
jgi:hypothetical protein